MKLSSIIILAGVLLGACKKSDNVITQMVTPTYPVITLSGEPLLSLGIGGTYTDPGARAFDSLSGATTQLTPYANNVDLSKPGFYSVKFLAKNAYGYRTYATRLVLATTVPAADDISGTYKRTTNGAVLHIEKVGTGAYKLDNVAGVANNPDYIFPFYIGFTDLTTFVGPAQLTPFGDLSIGRPEIVRNGTSVQLSWFIDNGSFPTNTRTFVRQ
ncbi:MAG TPA: immunoglobulin-like domain-containing protein [Chitinophaga sp.]|uniref:immunoglobulin-like domain-containing protein n=1 Tax=Chitinophaga sp. TaxID=1869181 RepID=UPI002BDD6530|nr:immunoglobulin-like domain-containing protein [Chitinophaga sp.]HVI47808.1 immunoglobulin-like domain-containing protein [Chitinophaga sp.]